MTHTPKVPALPLVLLSLAAVALALLLGAGPAAGGGYSTMTLDPLAAAPQAGATLRVGYTVKMHGATPVGVDGSGIAVVGPGGVRTVAPGRPDGPLGHYLADVRFPAAGSWTWEYVQDGTTMQDLGRIEVAPAADVAGAASSADGGGPGAAAWALLAATIAAAAVLAGVALRPGRATAG